MIENSPKVEAEHSTTTDLKADQIGQDLTQGRLRELLRYDPETGIFTWLARSETSKDGKRWNLRYAGTKAGMENKLNGTCWITVHKNNYAAHRLAWLYMTGEFPSLTIDHIDRNRLNNKWDNLRLATYSQNCANKIARKDGTSGFKGVTWDKSHNKWRAHIGVNYKKIHLGRYDKIEDAAKAYQEASKKYFGEFSRYE